MAISSAQRPPQTEEDLAKAATQPPADGDGDGWIYDGTAQQRRVTESAHDLLQRIRNTQHGMSMYDQRRGMKRPMPADAGVKLLVDRGLAKIDRSGTVKLTGTGDRLLTRSQRQRSDDREAARQQWEADNPHMAKLLKKYESTTKNGEKIPRPSFRTMYVGERPKNPTVSEIKKMTPKQRKAYLQLVANVRERDEGRDGGRPQQRPEAGRDHPVAALVRQVVEAEQRLDHFRQAESYIRRLKKAGFKIPAPENMDIPAGFQD